MKFIKKHKLNESTFSTKNWSHNGKFDYALDVVNKLLHDEDLRLGPKGEFPFKLEASKFDKKELEKLRRRLEAKEYTCTHTELDDCLKDKSEKGRGSIWTSIFKGDFSHHNEKENGNNGNVFEKEYLSNFDELYKEKLQSVIGYFQETGPLDYTGPLNTRRPLSYNEHGNIICLPYTTNTQDPYNIGKAVTDVTVPTTNGNLYLSLKWGPTVTFINAGVKKLFPEIAFKENDYMKFSDMGRSLLDLFKIDPNRFITTFNNYKYPGNRKAVDKDCVDVTNYIDKDKLKDFIKSAVGYGYVLIHQLNDDIHVYDIRRPEQMINLIGGERATEEDMNPIKVIVKYPKNYDAKRIDVIIDYRNITLDINIRAKDGTIYPTHIMSDYKIKGV